MKEEMNSMEIIKLENVNKQFGDKNNLQNILNNISITVTKGEMISIMGPSGSGKTTLMNIMGLLDKKTSGKYWLDGEEVSNLKDSQISKIRNRKIGFVFQNFNLIKELTAIENVKMNLMISNIHNKKEKIKQKEMNLKCNRVLEDMGLKEHINKKPGQLSGGQQQRVAIARALVNNPDIILADEPTGALDSKTGEEVMECFLKLKEQGKTIIIVTHDEKVGSMCQRIIRLKDGNIIN